MPTSPSYRDFVLDQLSRVASGIRGRGMFGGVGIYCGDLFFALIADDTLYLKVDDETREGFVAAGMGPFMPFGDGGEVMQYYEVPADALEEPERLRPWAEQAIEVARRARHRKTVGKVSAIKKRPRKKPASKKRPRKKPASKKPTRKKPARKRPKQRRRS